MMQMYVMVYRGKRGLHGQRQGLIAQAGRAEQAPGAILGAPAPRALPTGGCPRVPRAPPTELPSAIL